MSVEGTRTSYLVCVCLLASCMPWKVEFESAVSGGGLWIPLRLFYKCRRK